MTLPDRAGQESAETIIFIIRHNGDREFTAKSQSTQRPAERKKGFLQSLRRILPYGSGPNQRASNSASVPSF